MMPEDTQAQNSADVTATRRTLEDTLQYNWAAQEVLNTLRDRYTQAYREAALTYIQGQQANSDRYLNLAQNSKHTGLMLLTGLGLTSGAALPTVTIAAQAITEELFNSLNLTVPGTTAAHSFFVDEGQPDAQLSLQRPVQVIGHSGDHTLYLLTLPQAREFDTRTGRTLTPLAL